MPNVVLGKEDNGFDEEDIKRMASELQEVKGWYRLHYLCNRGLYNELSDMVSPQDALYVKDVSPLFGGESARRRVRQREEEIVEFLSEVDGELKEQTDMSMLLLVDYDRGNIRVARVSDNIGGAYVRK